MRILVVEDDPALSEALQYSLKQAGHAVDPVANGVMADQILRHEQFDLIVLDLNLPQLDGFEVLRRMRAQQCTSPVLILSARDQDRERVTGLDLGADDYLVKPFSINELLARVRALLRRGPRGTASRKQTHAGLSFDSVSRTAAIGDVPLDLSAREVSLLEAFLGHFGQIMSKERLLSQVYGYEGEVGLNTIEVYIHRLRKKLVGTGVVLRTAHGRGYLLDLERSETASPRE
jgi:two-component system, OmpR family, response regulator